MLLQWLLLLLIYLKQMSASSNAICEPNAYNCDQFCYCYGSCSCPTCPTTCSPTNLYTIPTIKPAIVPNTNVIPTIVPSIKPYVDGVETCCNQVKGYADDIPTIIPTLKPLVDNLESRIPSVTFPTINTIAPSIKPKTDLIPTIIPTIKPLVDSLESRIPSALFPTVTTIKGFVDDIPTIAPSIKPNTDAIPTIIPTIKPLVDNLESRVPSALHPTVLQIKGYVDTLELTVNQINYELVNSEANYNSKPTIKYDLDTIQDDTDQIPTIIPTIKPLVVNLESRTQQILAYATALEPTFNTIESRIPSALYPTMLDIQRDIANLTSSLGGIELILAAIEQNQLDCTGIRDDILDLELLFAHKSNQTIDELKEYLDRLHSRVQLRPTSASSLPPTVDPTNDPTSDPTNFPTRVPTVPSAEPTSNPSIEPTSDPSTEPTYGPTADPVTAWKEGFTLGGNDNSYNGEVIDLGHVEFNNIFQSSEYHIIRRECSTCADGYKEVFYKRLLEGNTFDAYDNMRKWRTDSNNYNTWHYRLYTSIEDALLVTDDNWKFCDFTDDGSTGAFSTCGPGPTPDFIIKNVTRDMCSYPLDANSPDFIIEKPCNKPAKFSIFVGIADEFITNPQNAIVNEEKAIGDHETLVVNESDGKDDDNSRNVNITINAKQFDLMIIGIIGLVLISLNALVIALKCIPCKCKKASMGDHKFQTVKSDKFETDEAEDNEIEDSKTNTMITE